MAMRAVLIGINRYQVPGSDLRGCVNDVKNLGHALTMYYGFSAQDITSLTDLQATKKAMQSTIKKLITGGKKGDVLLLHYSGHGSNVPDDNGDEADHRDEILCPTDLDWDDPLSDD
jgi:metacaspase-1